MMVAPIKKGGGGLFSGDDEPDWIFYPGIGFENMDPSGEFQFILQKDGEYYALQVLGTPNAGENYYDDMYFEGAGESFSGYVGCNLGRVSDLTTDGVQKYLRNM